jgi:chromosome segregation ATPase
MHGPRIILKQCCLGLVCLSILPGCWPHRFTFLRSETATVISQPPALTGIQTEPGAGDAADQRGQLEEITRKAAQAEKQRQRLEARVQELERALAEKDQAITQVNLEMQASLDDLARARADLQRWSQELTSLRTRLREAEKENLTNLHSMIEAMEGMLRPDHSPQERDRPEETPKSDQR